MTSSDHWHTPRFKKRIIFSNAAPTRDDWTRHDPTRTLHLPQSVRRQIEQKQRMRITFTRRND